MSLFISVTISGKEGIGILFISGRVAAIIAALLGSLSLDLLDIFQFTSRAGLIGNNINNFILLLESFQLFLPFVFVLLVLFHSSVPIP